MHLGFAWYVVIGLLGLVFGSFFNVAIHRWPKEDKREREWVVTPSHCPSCGKPIRWYDNIPLASWLILRGKCRDCKAPISVRYPLVELGNALLWLLTAYLVDHVGFSGVDPARETGWHVGFALLFASFYFLTVIIDFETQIIPEEISIGHLAGSLLFMWLCAGATVSSGWISSVIGAVALAAFYGIFFLIGAMGGGDVLLALGIGVLFGWPLIAEQGFLSLVLGGIPSVGIMLVLLARRKYKFGKTFIAFGPFIGVAAYISMFWGWQILAWYFGLFTPAGHLPVWLSSHLR